MSTPSSTKSLVLFLRSLANHVAAGGFNTTGYDQTIAAADRLSELEAENTRFSDDLINAKHEARMQRERAAELDAEIKNLTLDKEHHRDEMKSLEYDWQQKYAEVTRERDALKKALGEQGLYYVEMADDLINAKSEARQQLERSDAAEAKVRELKKDLALNKIDAANTKEGCWHIANHNIAEREKAEAKVRELESAVVVLNGRVNHLLNRTIDVTKERDAANARVSELEAQIESYDRHLKMEHTMHMEEEERFGRCWKLCEKLYGYAFNERCANLDELEREFPEFIAAETAQKENA